ncbi:MAG: amidohydrolase family protein [Bacteroidota bacterium]
MDNRQLSNKQLRIAYVFLKPSATLRLCVQIVFVLFIRQISFSQNPAPALPQAKSILLTGGTVHVGNGKIIENAAVGFKDGKIILAADATLIRLQNGAFDTTINVSGKQIYPGFIAANTTLGLSELELVRATNDYTETGKLNPSVRSIVSHNTDSKVIPTIRSNGVLLAETVPQGGLISGQSSVVELDAWNWEDAAYKTDIGIHLNWPQMTISKTVSSIPADTNDDVQKKNIDKSLQEIKDLFNDAKAYSKIVHPDPENLHLEAMKGLFNGTKKLFVHANNVKQIVAAVNFCKEYNISMVLVGGDDAWRVTDLLKQNNILVIIGRTHSLPSRQDEDVDLPYKLPYLLQKAGVTFCNSVDGFWQVRNIMFNAGTDVAYGLTKEEAITAITSSPAKILGIDKTVGTIEEGKDATIIVSSGDALDMKTNNIEMAFIRGKQINLDNVQKQLYKKYMTKYGLKM